MTSFDQWWLLHREQFPGVPEHDARDIYNEGYDAGTYDESHVDDSHN